MFGPITIPQDAVMLFNTIELKAGTTAEDIEFTLGELCSIVKEEYKDDGFIAGQVFEYTGFISDEGSVTENIDVKPHVAIVTYWRSFEQHERSHADKLFKEKLRELFDASDDIRELGYNNLWQGMAEE